MLSVDDVAEFARSLPEVDEGVRYGNRTWLVRKKAFVWERAFSKADIKRYGTQEPPSGPIVAVTVDDLVEKQAVLEAGHAGVFTIPHFDKYPAVLIALDAAADDTVRELIVDGWLAVAPPPLADVHADRLLGRA